MRALVFLPMLLLPGVALAQPACSPQLQGTVACFPRAVSPQLGDLLSGMQTIGPSKPSQSVGFTLAQIVAMAGTASFASPPPLGNVAPSQVFATAFSATGAATFYKTISDSWTTTTATDSPILNVQRTTSHTGGTPGFVDFAGFMKTTVGAGVTNNEWTFTSVLENYATTTTGNVAGYFQAHKRSTGQTFAAVFEATDYNNQPSSVAGSLVSSEFDVTSSGLDDYGNGIRIGQDIVVTQTPGTSNPVEVGYGSRVDVSSGNSVRRGYSVLGTFNQAAFDASLGTAGTRSGVAAAAFRSAPGQLWDFGGDSNHTLKLNQFAPDLQYTALGNVVLNLTESGVLSVADSVDAGNAGATSAFAGNMTIGGTLGVTAAVTLSGAINAGASAGVMCSGTPTPSFASVNGIVTHC